jgi:uncharacterized protein YdiU (UPF0061 family)
MHALGVPTTRVKPVATGETVVRDMFSTAIRNPNPARSCAASHRSCASALRSDITMSSALRRLADYVITHHFPELSAPSQATYARWFEEICRRTATLVTEWMRVGFVHGVLNTDNMSILGLTIDYGPYGWLEGYDLQWTPNTTDAQGRRYCYATSVSRNGIW